MRRVRFPRQFALHLVLFAAVIAPVSGGWAMSVRADDAAQVRTTGGQTTGTPLPSPPRRGEVVPPPTAADAPPTAFAAPASRPGVGGPVVPPSSPVPPAPPAVRQPAPAPPAPPAPGVALGVSSLWDVAGRTDAYIRDLGVAPAVVQWYSDWAHAEFYAPNAEAITQRGAIPLLSWEPDDYTLQGKPQPAYAPRRIVAGEHDTYIRTFARQVRAWGKPLYLRFAWEMNGDWYAWGVGSVSNPGNTSADYVAMWRHVHGLFAQEGATNVRWVWCPNVDNGDTAPIASLYPGDAYVDYVGLDGYNWGALQNRWRGFSEVFAASYAQVTALTDKPVMINEVGSHEAPGDKAGWITSAFLAELPANFPRVRVVIWYQENRETDWRYNSSPATLAAFRAVAQSPRYRGQMP